MHANLTTLTTQDGRQLEYLVTGRAEGPALLFHTGMPSAAVDFSWLTGPATASGIRTISYSRPGYGTSMPAWMAQPTAAADSAGPLASRRSLTPRTIIQTNGTTRKARWTKPFQPSIAPVAKSTRSAKVSTPLTIE